MNCEYSIDLIQRRVDNDLSEQESLELNAHLKSCPSCTLMLERLQALHEQLLQLPQVKPKISIVDSILPKLLEIESQELGREESAALAPQELRQPVRESARTKRFLGYVSWKMTSAVAVAACAILFFVLNQGEVPRQGSLADSVLEHDGSKTTAAPAPEATPVASQQETNSLEQTQSTSQTAEPAAKTDESNATEKAAVDEQKGTEVKSLNFDPNAAKDKSPAASPTREPAKSGVTTPLPQPSAAPEPKGTTATDGGQGSPTPVAIEPAPVPGAVDTHGITSLVPDDKIGGSKEDPNANKRLANEQFVAEVKERKLTISSISTSAVVFTSPRQWTELETVIPVGWTPEGKFYYEVAGNGVVRAFLIDVRSRTELQIK